MVLTLIHVKKLYIWLQISSRPNGIVAPIHWERSDIVFSSNDKANYLAVSRISLDRRVVSALPGTTLLWHAKSKSDLTAGN